MEMRIKKACLTGFFGSLKYGSIMLAASPGLWCYDFHAFGNSCVFKQGSVADDDFADLRAKACRFDVNPRNHHKLDFACVTDQSADFRSVFVCHRRFVKSVFAHRG